MEAAVQSMAVSRVSSGPGYISLNFLASFAHPAFTHRPRVLRNVAPWCPGVAMFSMAGRLIPGSWWLSWRGQDFPSNRKNNWRQTKCHYLLCHTITCLVFHRDCDVTALRASFVGKYGGPAHASCLMMAFLKRSFMMGSLICLTQIIHRHRHYNNKSCHNHQRQHHSIFAIIFTGQSR